MTDATSRTVILSPEEQYQFWIALNKPVKLTAAQKALGRLMRGES